MKLNVTSVGAIAILAHLTAHAQFGIGPLTTFGGGDGWFAPGEGGYSFLGTGNNERGLAYGNSHLYLLSRSGGLNLRVLDPLTGTDLGSPLDVTGISGGTFALSMIAVAGDGVIYGANLTTQASSSPFKVYAWGNEGSTPVVVYSGAPINGARVGDTFAASGSGSSTLLAAGFGSSPSTNGNNGYAIVNPTAGTAAGVAFAVTPPNAGDFRLGISFAGSGSVWGSQGTSLRYTTFSGVSGTLLGSFAPVSTAERLLAYTVINGVPILAAQSTGDSHVSIYDVTDPINPILVGTGNNTSGTLAGNANGTGELAWGALIDNGDGTSSQRLYAMSSNQGIQAFIVTVPEPTTLALIAIGLGLLLRWRKAR